MNLVELLLTTPVQDNEVAWIDKEGKEYRMRDIQDSHLLNILRFVCRGKGHSWFLTESKIRSLFEEADRRGLKHRYNIHDALYEMRSQFRY